VVLLLTVPPVGEGEPSLLLDAEGRVLDASEDALAMLGLGLDELRALPAGALSSSSETDRAALRAAWEEAEASAAVGETTIVRPDGRRMRVDFALFAQSDGTYRVILKPADVPVDQPTKFFAVGDVLAAWREAERRLATVESGSAEWDELQARIAALREQHRRLFRKSRAQPG
jgi:8-oxo-dGTP pyrophosphatase MutT (NUDIX family)